MRFVLLAIFSSVVILMLMTVGQHLKNFGYDVLWLEAGYIQSLSAEVGGAGIEAFLVGGLAGLVASQFIRGRERRAFGLYLERRRRAGRAVQISDVLDQWPSGLDLSGFTFSNVVVEDAAARRITFVRPRGRRPDCGAAVFERVNFNGCTFDRVRFGNGRSGCRLISNRLTASIFRWCDFGAVEIQGSDALFSDTQFIRCRFDRSKLIDASMEHVTFRGCTFWGATFIDSRLPPDTFAALDRVGAVVTLPGGAGRGVISLAVFLRQMSRARLAYLFNVYALGR